MNITVLAVCPLSGSLCKSKDGAFYLSIRSISSPCKPQLRRSGFFIHPEFGSSELQLGASMYYDWMSAYTFARIRSLLMAMCVWRGRGA